ITAPRQTMALYLPERAIFLATMGISKEPGTLTTVTFPSSTPPCLKASIAPVRSLLVINALKQGGGEEGNVPVVRVPGSFEIPMVARKMALSGKYNAIVCLGAVIRGATPHFEYIAAEVTKGIANTGMEAEIPVIYGVLTTDTVEQAIERAGSKNKNKGWDAAIQAIEMANLYKRLK